MCYCIFLNPSLVDISGGSKGVREGRTPPPQRPNSFNFMQFLGEFGKIVCSRPPPPLEGSRPPPPWGNPGSVTGYCAPAFIFNSVFPIGKENTIGHCKSTILRKEYIPSIDTTEKENLW